MMAEQAGEAEVHASAFGSHTEPEADFGRPLESVPVEGADGWDE